MFPLYFACADTMNKGFHEERCIVGAWLGDEDLKAVDMGYGLVDVFVFWRYKVTCFDKDTNSGGILAQYFNKFLKLKQE